MKILEELERAGAVLLGQHFVYKSGKHGPNYINMDPLFPATRLMRQVVEDLVMPFVSEGVEVIIGPPTGGLVLATMAVSRWPSAVGEPPELVWPTKQEDGFVFERASFAERLKGKRVLAIEDLLNTGGSVGETCRQAEGHGAKIIGVSVVCNRGGATAETLGVPRLETLSQVDFDMFEEKQCPLCAEGRPIVTDIGHGAKYQVAHPDYPGGYTSLLGPN